jgi:glutamate formiminotransferase/glutamate formiminotransferase/formiminotetrahydrofolate cyclodeaminase
MSPNAYVDDSLRSFLVKLSNRSPEPAGGAALALAAASAAALTSLACHPPGPESELGPETLAALETCQRSSEELLGRVQHLIDEDVHAYREVSRCLRLPQATPGQRDERRDSLDEALHEATEVPLEVAQASLDILDLAISVAPAVRPAAAGDLAAAIHLAEAAVKGSLRNARINAAAMRGSEYPVQARQRIEAMNTRLREASAQAGQVLRAKGVPE